MRALSAFVLFASTVVGVSGVAAADDVGFDVIASVGSITVTAHQGFHINKDYPWKVTIGDKKMGKESFRLGRDEGARHRSPHGTRRPQRGRVQGGRKGVARRAFLSRGISISDGAPARCGAAQRARLAWSFSKKSGSAEAEGEPYAAAGEESSALSAGQRRASRSTPPLTVACIPAMARRHPCSSVRSSCTRTRARRISARSSSSQELRGSEEATPIVEVGAEGEEEGALATQRLGGAQRKEAVVLERHALPC